MQYLVNVSGDVFDKQNKTYIVNSDTVENAKNIATQNFCDEFSVSSYEVCVKPHKRTHTAISAFVCMLIPILLSLINWKHGHNTISICPDYISCLYSVLIYAAFVVRFKGIKRTAGSWIDILFCVFIVLLLASFIKTVLVTQTINLFGLKQITISTNILFPIILILSWIGLKIVSLTCIAGIILISMFNIIALNEAMGMIFGSLYIVCSFVGILLYLSIEPALDEILINLKKSATRGLSNMSKDVSQVKNKISEMKCNRLKTDHQEKNEG